MRVELDPRWTTRLLEFSESEMLTRRVDVRLADGREFRDLLVFNGEELELPRELAGVTIADLRLHAAWRAADQWARELRATSFVPTNSVLDRVHGLRSSESS